MRKLNRNLVGALVAAFAMAGAAQAQVIAPTTVSAMVHLPYQTSGANRVTVGTVTNTDLTTNYRLHIEWIGKYWSGIDFNCPLTPGETTYFVFEKGFVPGTAKVTFECSDQTATGPDPSRTNNIFTRSLIGEDGIMMVVTESANAAPATASTVAANVLVGDSTVIDFAQGTALSVPGVHVQAIAPNADRTYLYDGAEFAFFPNALTTNYIAPDNDITAELLLYTPDGTVGGGPGVNARLTGFAFDDDENETSGVIGFDCYTLVRLDDPFKAFGANVRRDFGGHLVGHVQLFPDLALRTDIHDLDPTVGDGNGARRAPVHGWLVQSIANGGELDGGNFGGVMAGPGAWARQLGQSDVQLAPLGADVAGTVAD